MIESSNVKYPFFRIIFYYFAKGYQVTETGKADDTNLDHLKAKINNLLE